MFHKSFQQETCNRRDFISAASILVVGGMISCNHSGGDAASEEKKQSNNIFPVPTTQITMRVRVGRARSKSGFVIDGDQIYISQKEWNTPRTSKLSPDINSKHELWIHKGGSHKISVLEKTKSFTGKVSLHKRPDVSNYAFDIVAHIPMETYLPGVVAGELFSHWHPNTFAAQVVAARSYATTQHLQRKLTSHFDVSDGPSSQVFLGDVTLEVAHRSVKDTEDIVLTWNNSVVPAYYSACCGGLAATANDAIGPSPLHNIRPLQGRDGSDVCTTLDIHKWQTERSHRNFKNRLVTWASSSTTRVIRELQSIKTIMPTQTNKHGRPTKLEIVDRKGATFPIDAKNIVRAANALYPSIPDPTTRVWSSYLTASGVGKNIEISGFGMGHGVGLCQYGSQVLAGRGASWEHIVEQYYPGSKLL